MVINTYSIIIIIAAIAIAGALITVSFNNEEEQQVTQINLPEECLTVRDAVMNLSFEELENTEEAANTLAEMYCEDKELQSVFPNTKQEYEFRLLSFACEISSNDIPINITRLDSYKDKLSAYKDVYCSNISSIVAIKAQTLLDRINELESDNLESMESMITAQMLINDALTIMEEMPYTAYTKLDEAEAIIIGLE